jgi:hypothetical protein
MKPAEEIERSLQQLAPAPLSRRATDAIESMLDELAPGEDVAGRPGSAPGGWRRPALWAGLAAAVVLGGLSAPMLLRPAEPAGGGPVGEAAGEPAPAHSLEWVGRTDHVEGREDGGLLADENGGMHRLLRYRVVEERVVRDGRSGALMRVTGSREETVLVPVSTF